VLGEGGSDDPADPREGFVQTDQGRLHYLDWGGDGPEAHLLHANGFCAGTYAPMVRHFGGRLRVVASDIRGHGDSDAPDPRAIRHWEMFAEDLRWVVEGAMSPPVIGIGHSLGGVATYIAAATYPHLFSRIILLDPVILPRKSLWLLGLFRAFGLGRLFPLARGARRRRRSFESKTAALRRFAGGRGIFKTWSEDFIEAYLECGLLEEDQERAILKCDPEIEARIYESIPLDVWRYAPRIQCPVLAMRGEKSETFRADAAKRLAKVVPECRVEVVKDAGHFFPMEEPAACAEGILGFVAGVSEPQIDAD
jgi:pimeloyl-ACP methyl ester carboxylesterase